jgi:Carbohydrate/starch-binding module (family 21)
MPYAIAARPNPSASTSTVHIFTSLLQLSPDHPVGSKLLSVLSPGCTGRVECKATIARTRTPTPPATTSKIVASSSDSAVRKPLKSSLKRCSSRAPTPTVPDTSDRTSATQSRRCVRFKEIDDQLESVCFFRPTGRPSAIFSPISDSDSESESETASSDDDAPAPSLARLPGRRASVAAAAIMVPLEAADIVSPIPSPHTPLTRHTHVRLEFLSSLAAGLGQGQVQGHPLLYLHGIVRVRNIAYEKCVAVRYTHDNWDTAIEVLARYTGPSTLTPTVAPTTASGASGDGSRDRDDGPWDWFTFTISLGLRAPRASLPRTLLLAVRFTVAGAGEWWDNNGGEDFRIVLAPSPAGRLGRGGTEGGGHGKGGPGLESEFVRQPLAVPCSTDDVHARVETAWPAAPAPTAVMNRWIYIACA